jgi:hypothetical protein
MLLAMALFGVVLLLMALVGLILNVLLFPEMWRQDDVPSIVRWFAERPSGR